MTIDPAARAIPLDRALIGVCTRLRELADMPAADALRDDLLIAAQYLDEFARRAHEMAYCLHTYAPTVAAIALAGEAGRAGLLSEELAGIAAAWGEQAEQGREAYLDLDEVTGFARYFAALSVRARLLEPGTEADLPEGVTRLHPRPRAIPAPAPEGGAA